MILKKKRIVITGGTSGIGYEITKHLHSENELIVIARNAARLTTLMQEFEGIYTFQADLCHSEEVKTVADTIVKQFDSIDVLINNAAIQNTPRYLDDDFSFESISREISLNFTSVCHFSYLFLPALLHKQQAVILNINSGLALAPKTSSAIYCATKGALNIFTQSLRYQLENTNISVQQAILPLVDTAMTMGRGKNKLSTKTAARHIIRGIERNIPDHDIGKVKLLRLLLRLAPSFAHRMLKYA